MKQELEIKLQAWVDGELSETGARHIAQIATTDPEAGRLAAELRHIKSAMAGSEMARTVPEGREFYWSKIQRQINLESRPAPRRPNPALGWRRFLMPLAGLAAASCVVLLTLTQSTSNPPAANYDEITATDEAMDTMTIHDQSSGMTVVWLQDKSSPVPPAATALRDDNSADTD